jgi:hypothetical protein
LRIDSSGNLGLGTTSPTFRFVAANNNFDGVGIGSSSTYSFLTIGGYFSSSAGAAQIGFERSTGAFTFGNGTRDVPTERMRIDNSGRVAIGTASATAKLTISEAAPGVATGQLLVKDPGYSGVALAQGGTGEGYLWNIANSYLSIGTNSTERMRINNVGHVLINETSASSASLQHNFEVNGDIMSNGSSAGLFWANRSAAPSSGSDWYGWYTTSGTIYIYNPAVGNLASINPSTGAYTALSDVAKKKDFEPSIVGLDAVMALKPTLFRMATDAADAPKQLGFIAQEVKDHIPQAYVEEQNVDAIGNETTYIGLNDRPIIAALVKAVQELTARVAELEGK